MTERVDVVVVGAGFAGIAVALALREAGVDSYLILEQADAAGGTWRDNTYPGVTCDVPAHLYGLSAHPNPQWPRLFASGPAIHGYLETVIRTAGLDTHLKLGTPLTKARWADEGWQIWTDTDTETSVAPTLIATYLVLCAGRLTEPRVPDLPGLDTFPGSHFHTARWHHTTPLDARRIAVVGAGASAVQLAPELARRGAQVTVFQRTPAWIMPRDDRTYTSSELHRFVERPDVLAAYRDTLFGEGEARFASRAGDTDRAERIARAHLAAQVPDRRLRSALTPQYRFGCKRVLLSDDFYPAVSDGVIALEPSALAEVHGTTLIAASGARRKADVLVFASGFETARQPYARLVRGEHGDTLEEYWSRGMAAVGSTLVPGFPNMFVLGGPHAALSHNSAVLLLEAQAEFAAEIIAGQHRDGTGGIRVTPAEEEEDISMIEQLAANTPWTAGGCRSWYVDDRSGRLTLLWPGSVEMFRRRLDSLRRRLQSPREGGLR